MSYQRTLEQTPADNINMIAQIEEQEKALEIAKTYLEKKSELKTVALNQESKMTLPTDSNERKEYPLFRGALQYFPAAIAGVANISKKGNDKHNPGEEMHHARSKSPDHPDCIVRHLIDTADLLASLERGGSTTPQDVLHEVNQLAWRALAFSQALHEQFGAPMAPGAKK